jgi:hypothetical protein
MIPNEFYLLNDEYVKLESKLQKVNKGLKFLYIFDFIAFSVSCIASVVLVSDIMIHWSVYGKWLVPFFSYYMSSMSCNAVIQRFKRIVEL